MLALIVVVILTLCGFALRATISDLLSQMGSVFEPPPPSTPILTIIYEVATPLSPTVSLPTIEIPTIEPTATPTLPPLFSPTPTRRGGATFTPTRALPTPTLPSYPAPKLVFPLDRTIYNGAEATINLEWQPISSNGLRENEWYFVSISYTARDGTATIQNSWSRETRWTVRGIAFKDIAADKRMFQWSVTIMRVEGTDPNNSAFRVPISPKSETRTFFWQ